MPDLKNPNTCKHLTFEDRIEILCVCNGFPFTKYMSCCRVYFAILQFSTPFTLYASQPITYTPCFRFGHPSTGIVSLRRDRLFIYHSAALCTSLNRLAFQDTGGLLFYCPFSRRVRNHWNRFYFSSTTKDAFISILPIFLFVPYYLSKELHTVSRSAR